MKINFLILSLLLFPNLSQASPIWKVEQNWSVDWEKKYSTWISEVVTTDFYLKHKIATDCADAVVGLRWIFSRENHLPAAATFLSSRDPRTAHQTLFTQDDEGPWTRLPQAEKWNEDQRFLSALRNVFDNVFTKSVPFDSYPIALTAEMVTAGAFYSQDGDEMGHVQLIARTNWKQSSDEPFTLYASTVPSAVRELFHEPLLITSIPEPGFGIMRFRWPVKNANGKWELTPAEKMPGYSLEQYDSFEINRRDGFFDDYLIRKVTGSPYNYRAKVRNLIRLLKEKWQNRILIVEEGFAKCSISGCPAKSAVYEDYSTPSRDKNILYFIATFKGMISSLQNGLSQDDITKSQIADSEWRRAQGDPVLTLGQRQLSFGELAEIWSAKKYSTDPNDGILIRWGL